MTDRYYARDGSPISMEQWATEYERGNRLERTTVRPLVEVSTVWLGLNHRFGAGAPLIFETLVFGGVLDGEMDRYSTEAQARAGHAAMVARVEAAEAEKET